MEIYRNALQIPSNVKLADIEFHKPSVIDMLVGAECFFELLQAEKIELGGNRPLLQNTKLGWVIAGSIALDHTANLTCTRSTIATLNCSLEHCETLNENLERFWEIETVQSETNRVLSSDEQQCEEFFERTTVRDNEGRFVVRLLVLRVFDASSKTDSGLALNDILYVGPTLQSILIEIVMRFRFHNIALTGDLRKMYRQIIVHPDDRDYQRTTSPCKNLD